MVEILLFIIAAATIYLLFVNPQKRVTFKGEQMIIQTSRFSNVAFSRRDIQDVQIFEGGLPKGAVVINGSWYRGNASSMVSAIDTNRIMFTALNEKYVVNVVDGQNFMKKYQAWLQET